MKTQRHHTRHHVGLILALAGVICSVALIEGPARPVSAQAVAPSWSYTGNLNTGRVAHTATLLLNGNVLVVGGHSSSAALKSAELYDPITGTWSSTSNLNTTRLDHTATLLQDGKVLVAGGLGVNNDISNTAELYDPATGTWSLTGNLNAARFWHTATLLPNGKVLVAGGVGSCDRRGCFALTSAELYDPATGTWSSTGNLNIAHTYHTATLLPDGKTLVAGGSGNGAELYDPATGIWSITGNLNAGRGNHAATLLPNGKVLVAGGFYCDEYDCPGLNSAELYDPATGTWSITGNLNTVRSLDPATLLPNGKVLITGGGTTSGELYDPTTGMWSITANLNTARAGYTATLLPDGKVLVAGGYGGGNFLNSAELYDPGTNPISNQIDDAQFFVRQHYRDFLNRDADLSGLAFWTNEIALCGADQECIEAKRINVSAAFFISIEFQQTGYLVYRFYKA
jgi:WD40 repeat protein